MQWGFSLLIRILRTLGQNSLQARWGRLSLRAQRSNLCPTTKSASLRLLLAMTHGANFLQKFCLKVLSFAVVLLVADGHYPVIAKLLAAPHDDLNFTNGTTA